MFLQTYLSLLFLQLLATPLFAYLSKTFTQIKDGLWAFARFFTWLVLSLIIFFIAYLKIPINNSLGVYFVLLVFFLLNIYFLFIAKHCQQHQELLKNYWQKFRRQIIIEELIFLAFLFFY